MFKITAETFAKNYVYNIIDKDKKLWLRNKDIGEKSGFQNIHDLVDKEIKGKCEDKNHTKKKKKKKKIKILIVKNLYILMKIL